MPFKCNVCGYYSDSNSTSYICPNCKAGGSLERCEPKNNENQKCKYTDIKCNKEIKEINEVNCLKCLEDILPNICKGFLMWGVRLEIERNIKRLKAKLNRVFGFQFALERAILNTLKNCCVECDSEEKCVPFEQWDKLSYDELIRKIDDVECGDFYFPLDEIKKNKNKNKEEYESIDAFMQRQRLCRGFK